MSHYLLFVHKTAISPEIKSWHFLLERSGWFQKVNILIRIALTIFVILNEFGTIFHWPITLKETFSRYIKWPQTQRLNLLTYEITLLCNNCTKYRFENYKIWDLSLKCFLGIYKTRNSRFLLCIYFQRQKNIMPAFEFTSKVLVFIININ